MFSRGPLFNRQGSEGMAYLFLFSAIMSEVVGAIATRFSAGLTRPLPTALAVVGVVGAYDLLSLVPARGIGIGVAYALWAALGVASVAVIGAVFLGDKLSWVQMGEIVLVVAGVLSLARRRTLNGRRPLAAACRQTSSG
jgi:small multidrug resistance pump